jgi:glycosyltransferase involved in cell wall biosynthesis
VSIPSVPPALPRILFLDHVGELGGAELCLVDMARHTHGRSKVILMAEGPLQAALAAVDADVAVLRLPGEVSRVRRASGLLRGLLAAPQVMRLAWKIAREAGNFDLIWANSQKAFVVGCFASLLARKPLIWLMHDILTADHFSSTNRRVAVSLANRFAARVVTVSNTSMQSFINSNGNPEIACVVYNGIDPEKFGFVPGSGSASSNLRTEFGIGSRPLVGVFGRITPWKGQDILIRALPALPGVHAVFVGEALFKETQYADSLRTLAVKLGVADRAHFAGFRTNVAGAMAEVDLVAHTSTSPEPFGRVLVEAMLARKPLIASAAGGAAEIISHGHDGVLVPPGNPASLATAILELLENPSATVTLLNEGYQTAITKFSLAGFLARMDAVVAEVMQESSRSSPDAGSEASRRTGSIADKPGSSIHLRSGVEPVGEHPAEAIGS